MKSKKTNKAYLTPNEVAEMLMVSPITVRQWAQKGLLRALSTPGGHRRFLPLDVERFAQERGLAFHPLAGDQLRLLVVDDDRQFLDYLVELLVGYSEKVILETAKDGFEAGWKVQAFRPHVVLMDLMMPGIDGFEVCKRLKDDPATKAIRVIAMTGFFTKGNEGRILKSGAEACLAKPIDSRLLLQTLGLSLKVPA